MLGIAADSPASGARFVGCTRLETDLPTENQNHCHTDYILHATNFLATSKLEN